jgi:tRNA G26 N,N-dimethylase Trm1
MYSHSPERNRVDVVDLDPYGAAAPFIDAAVQCITDGGMLFPPALNSSQSSLGQHRPLVCDMYGPLRPSHQQLSREMVSPSLLCLPVVRYSSSS